MSTSRARANEANCTYHAEYEGQKSLPLMTLAPNHRREWRIDDQNFQSFRITAPFGVRVRFGLYPIYRI